MGGDGRAPPVSPHTGPGQPGVLTATPSEVGNPGHQPQLLTKGDQGPPTRSEGHGPSPPSGTPAGQSLRVTGLPTPPSSASGSSLAFLLPPGMVPGEVGEQKGRGLAPASGRPHLCPTVSLAPAAGPSTMAGPPCQAAPPHAHSRCLLPGFGMSPWKGLEEKQRGECQGRGWELIRNAWGTSKTYCVRTCHLNKMGSDSCARDTAQKTVTRVSCWLCPGWL